jgi:superfamily II DNA or RNA helicase
MTGTSSVPASAAPPRTPFSHDDLARIFDAKTLKRGRTLVLNGAVSLVATAGPAIESIVVDLGQRHIVTVLPAPLGRGGSRIIFSNQCGCGRSACSHMAATALAALDQDPSWRRPVQGSFLDALAATPAASARPRPVPAPPPAPLKPAPAAASSPPAAPAEQRRVAFTLEPGAGDRAFFVGVMVEVFGPRTYRLEPSNPRDAIAAAAAGAAGDADRALCRLLGGSDQHRVGIAAQPAQIAEILLKRLLASGRCQWRNTGKVLAEGPARRIVAERRGGPKGGGALVYPGLPPGSAVIQAASAWYVDAAAGTMGPADVHVVEPRPPVVARVPAPRPAGGAAARPPAPPPAAGAIRSAPAAPPAGRGSTEVPVIVEAKPVPVLRLTRVVLPGVDGRLEPLDAAALSFVYDKAAIDPDDERQFARIERGDGEVVFARRDRAAESAALEALREAGLAMLRLASGRDDRGTRVHTYRGRDAAERWDAFVADRIPALEAAGWRVEVGEEFGPKLIDTIEEGDWQAEIVDTGDGWFSLDMGIDVDGVRLPLLPILMPLVEQGGMAAARIVGDKVHARLPDGRILALPADRVAKLLATLEEMIDAARVTAGGKIFLPAAEANAALDIESLVATRWRNAEAIRAFAMKLRHGDELPEVPLPPGFRAELRPYQGQGLNWLQHLRANGMAGILADDMGLGKTAQTLAHIAVEHHERRLTDPALIVVPTSLVANWVSEAAKFVPHLRVLVLHGLDRHGRRREIARADIVVTTYTVLTRDAELMQETEWHLVVLDEAQAIKNPDAKVTRAVCGLKARHRLSLSGTPIENNLSEIWAQFAFLMPGLLGDRKTFTKRFRTPIEKQGNAARRAQLARRIKPFLLRRTKAAVAADLPPKTEIVRRVDLDGDQRDLYETIRLSMHEKVREEIAAHTLAKSQIVVLDALLKLRQACCDPRLVKLAAARAVEGSGKLAALMEMLREMLPDGRRVLVFSQFTSMLDLIKQELVKEGIAYVELTGSTVDRATPVQRFQAGEVPLFLISLKAGGRGLNLTAADTVIHYDPWWNPAVEAQATDRAYRIGQDKPVFVYKLIAAGTVEERILDLQAKKGSLAAGALDDKASAEEIGDGKASSLDTDDIDFLFGAGPADAADAPPPPAEAAD